MEHDHKHHLLNQEEIAHLAHEMYLIEGKPEGREVDHWLAAERELAARASSSEAQKQAAPKPKAAVPVIKARKPRAVVRKT